MLRHHEEWGGQTLWFFRLHNNTKRLNNKKNLKISIFSNKKKSSFLFLSLFHPHPPARSNFLLLPSSLHLPHVLPHHPPPITASVLSPPNRQTTPRKWLWQRMPAAWASASLCASWIHPLGTLAAWSGLSSFSPTSQPSRAAGSKRVMSS